MVILMVSLMVLASSFWHLVFGYWYRLKASR